MPSKIQTSEWPAIAARREKGDSVAAIARDYGVSAASIYGILKQHKEADVGEAEAPAAAAVAAAPAPPPAPPPKPVPSPPPAAVAAAPPPVQRQSQLKLDVGANVKVDVGANGSSHAPRDAAPRREPEERQKPRRGTALDARLDQELRQEVDAAIADFQAAFGAALAAATPETVEHLRRAASDLMRAGARTTIVVERLGAVAPPPKLSAPAPVPAPAPVASVSAVQPSPPKGENGEAGEASSGTVKWFNTSKGFGFVKLDEAGADVFVHAQALQRAGIATLQEGQRVRLTARPGPKGPQADWIALEI